MRIVTASIVGGTLLAGFAAIGAGLISSIYEQTKEPIAAAERAAEARQLLEIFPASTHDNVLIDDTFDVLANDPLLTLREIGTGYRVRQSGEVVGVILPSTARDGYSGDIRLLVGVDRSGSLAGVRVLSHRETPGLGDKVELKKSDWVLSFNGRSLASPSSDGWAVTKDGGEFDAFTGATVTPRAVVKAVRETLRFAEENTADLFEVSDGVETES